MMTVKMTAMNLSQEELGNLLLLCQLSACPDTEIERKIQRLYNDGKNSSVYHLRRVVD